MQSSKTAQSLNSEYFPLRAGPFSMWFHEGDLRYVKLGEREVIRRIYGAVRDRHWGTIPGLIRDLEIETSDVAFRIRYTREHRDQMVHFGWRAEITGDADGTIRYLFDGEALAAFSRNRIGLCVLHPLTEWAGARCRVHPPQPVSSEHTLPVEVACEQPVPGFTPLFGLDRELEPGVWLRLNFEGDSFETEDQRNWMDASFKTYSTPIRMPFPVEVPSGTRIQQRVELRLKVEDPGWQPPPVASNELAAIVIETTGGAAVRVPDIGLGVASHGGKLTEIEIERLSRLGLAHLRVDLRLADPRWPQQLRDAAHDALELGTALELAIHRSLNGPSELAEVARVLGRLKVDLVRAMVFRDGQRTTQADDLDAAQAFLGDCGMALGAGTDGDLFYLGLQPPPDEGDFICWSMNPQVHATDDLTLAESPEGVTHQLATVHHRFPGLPLVLSPVTLKPRVRHTAPISLTEPPASFDERQRTLFGAAWTLAVLKAIAEGDVESVTLFETTGWLGVMANETAVASAGGDSSAMKGVYPVYHVLADMYGFGRGTAIPTRSSEPLAVSAMYLEAGGARRLILANLTAASRRVSLVRFEGIERLRILDASTMLEATRNPEAFRRRSAPFHSREFELPAHALATLDFVTL